MFDITEKLKARTSMLYRFPVSLIVNLHTTARILPQVQILFQTFCYRFAAVFGIIVLLYDPISAKL